MRHRRFEKGGAWGGWSRSDPDVVLNNGVPITQMMMNAHDDDDVWRNAWMDEQRS